MDARLLIADPCGRTGRCWSTGWEPSDVQRTGPACVATAPQARDGRRWWICRSSRARAVALVAAARPNQFVAAGRRVSNRESSCCGRAPRPCPVAASLSHPTSPAVGERFDSPTASAQQARCGTSGTPQILPGCRAFVTARLRQGKRWMTAALLGCFAPVEGLCKRATCCLLDSRERSLRARKGQSWPAVHLRALFAPSRGSRPVQAASCAGNTPFTGEKRRIATLIPATSGRPSGGR